jgi:dTMP kinase
MGNVKDKGKFFVLEGTNGCGKTTQQKILIDRITKEGYEVQEQSEPTHDMPIGELIRGTYFSGKRWCDKTLDNCLTAADRYEQTMRRTIPTLADGINIIQSRSVMSAIAIAYADNRNSDNPKNYMDLAEYIWNKNIDTYAQIRPDAIFWMDVQTANISVRLDALGDVRDIHETEKTILYSREGYQFAMGFLKARGFNIYQIDGDKTMEEVTNSIMDIMLPMLGTYQWKGGI